MESTKPPTIRIQARLLDGAGQTIQPTHETSVILANGPSRSSACNPSHSDEWNVNHRWDSTDNFCIQRVRQAVPEQLLDSIQLDPGRRYIFSSWDVDYGGRWCTAVIYGALWVLHFDDRASGKLRPC
jgi:hypothetical protein